MLLYLFLALFKLKETSSTNKFFTREFKGFETEKDAIGS